LIQLHRQNPRYSFAELLSIEYKRQPYKCPAASANQSRCNGQAFVQRWCFSLPLVFTIMIAWPPEPERDIIQRLFDMLPRTMDLEDILNVPNGKKQQQGQQNANSTSDSTYHLLGMILYYGRHYMACFYSDIFGAWILFDDKRVSKIGNWEHVRERCSRGKLQPTVLFYGSNQEVANRKKYSLEAVKNRAVESLQPKNGSEVIQNYFNGAQPSNISSSNPQPAAATGHSSVSSSSSNAPAATASSSSSSATPVSSPPPLPPRPAKAPTALTSHPDDIDGLFSSLSDDTRFGGYASPRNLPPASNNYLAIVPNTPSQNVVNPSSSSNHLQPIYQPPASTSHSHPQSQPQPQSHLHAHPYPYQYNQPMYQPPSQQVYQQPMYSAPQQASPQISMSIQYGPWRCSVCNTVYDQSVPAGQCANCSAKFQSFRK
jgi:hypothetical protein